MKYPSLFFLIFFLPLLSCNKEKDPISNATTKKLIFTLKFDPTQERLNAVGLAAEIPAGHAVQTPEFKNMSIHYIELSPNAFTPLGEGAIVFKGIETDKGGENAVDFDKALFGSNEQVFTTISIKDLAPGTYEWVRTSVTYQNYDIKFNLRNVPVIGDLDNQNGTVASFVGFNTYISTVRPSQKSLSINDDKKQGYWAFETAFDAPYDIYNDIYSGQAPASSTTVVNPIFQSSPIPPGSCVVTGKLATPLVITGKEVEDITIRLSYSTNGSFEWEDKNGNGQLDFFADDATKNEQIVDMGLRGLLPYWY